MTAANPPLTTVLLCLGVSTDGDPSVLTRLLGHFNNLNVIPRRVVAEFGSNALLHLSRVHSKTRPTRKSGNSSTFVFSSSPSAAIELSSERQNPASTGNDCVLTCQTTARHRGEQRGCNGRI